MSTLKRVSACILLLACIPGCARPESGPTNSGSDVEQRNWLPVIRPADSARRVRSARPDRKGSPRTERMAVESLDELIMRANRGQLFEVGGCLSIRPRLARS
jgi:hypothetical protein